MLPTTAVRKKLKSPGQDAIPNPKTSITCSNVPEDLFEPNTAKKHFNKFGRVQRIRLFPKKLACIVEYDLPSSAERAVLNAGAFDGFMFDVTRYKPRVRKRSKKEDDPDWVPDSDVEEELSAMSGAPTYRISRQKPMDIEPEASKLKQVTRVIKQSPIKKKFAVSKKPISTPSTISGIESPLVVATTQTTMSTFEAAAELHQLRSKVALTPDEQWRILDARDRVLRAWGGAGARVKVGGATLGTCQDMCPEKELLHRQAEHQVMTLETLLDSDGQLDSRRAVKQYSRSSADQEIPMCYELRPAPVLMRTCSYLLHEIADTRRSVSLADWFHFMWDRLRGIRKDITQQAMCCAESIRLVEMCARFHAHCAARLADLEHTQFDQKLNTDNITKCLQTLKHMYTDVTADQKPREAEFRGYIALLNLGDANFWWEIKQLPENIQKSEPIMFAIQVFNALDNNNYVRFFRLVKEKATYLQACILLRYFNDVRARALARIVKAYAPRGGSRFPAMELMSALAFDSVENMKSFISHYGLRFAKSDDYELAVILDRNQFIEDSDPFPIARAIQLIETKRQTSVGQVIAGGPIPHSDYRSHSLHTSFTKDGRLTEQALVAEDQGFNTTNDSNKDVKALKAEIQRLAQGSVYSSSHKEVEPKAPVFVKPDIRSFSPKPKTSLTAEAVQPSETKVFSFKPAITVAPTEIIENSPEKVFAEKNVFSFSKPHETDSMNVFNNIKDSSAGQTRNIFDNKVVVQDGKNMFVKKTEETKDPFKKSQNYFNSTERKETFVNKSNAPQSVFGQIDVKQNDLRSRLFGQTGAMQREPRSLFGQTEVKQDDSKSVFGQTDAKHSDSKSLFGQTEVKHGDAKSLFGQRGAMQSEPKSLFGPTEIKHGDSKSLFGQTEAKQSDAKSVFGKPESKQSDPRSLFGPKDSKQSDPKSLFGQTDAKQSDPKSLFGKTDQQSGPKSLFAPTESKQANPKSLFGQIDVKQSETRSLFGTTESKQSDPKSIFGQTDSKQSGPKNLFAQKDSMPSDSKSLFGTQNSNQNLFSANKENSLFTKPDTSKLDKGSNIFAKATAEETKPSSNIFGTFNNTTEPKSLFAPPEKDLQKKTPSIFNANGDIAGSNLSPGSLFKSAVNPPNGSDSKGYLIFQSKNKAQTVADNILNSVNAASQNNVYEFDKKEDDEAQRQMEEKIKEEQRLLQEQIRKEEEMRRQEQIRLQEEKRKEEARRKQEEIRLLEEKRKKEEARKLEELRKQEELRKRLEEEKKAELKRKAEEERKFKEAVDKESTQLVDDLVAEIVNETSKELLKCEHEDFMKVVALATNITEEITYEMCNEICHSEMKAELYLTKKIMKKWFYIWRNNFFRNLKRRKMLDDTPVWLTERTPTEEALYLRRRVEDATIKNMQAIHRGYKFSGELKLLPAPEPYNIMDIIRSPLLKRMKQICYPYDKCFFWKVSMISPGEDKWLYKKINVHKWLLDAFSDNKTHDESKTLIHVSKQSWNNLMDFAISVSLLNKDKLMNECSEAIEGTNAMLFISTENDPNLIDTIEQTLKHKYSYQRVPVAVIIPKIEQSSQIKLQEILNQHVNNRIISGFKIFVLDSKDVNELFNTSVKSALKWLAKKFPPTPPIEIDFLKSICQRYLGNEIWCRFRTERDSRMCDVIKDIYKLIDCYNAGVDKLTEIITNEDLFNHPSFPLEFRIYLDSSSPYPKPYEFIPSNVRTSENIATIKDYMKQLKLPVPSTSFNPMSVACMQQQIRTYCNQIGWFEDPEEVVCKVVAIIPIELSDINMPREDFTKYFAHYDLIDFLNIIIYEKINRLNNFNNRFAIYEKTVLQEHCTFNWLYDLQVISEMKHKAIEYEDELDYFIEAKRRKIAMDSIEYLMLEDKDSTMVEEDIKTTEFNISKYNDCSEAVKQLEKELDEEKKKSIEFENMLRAALADV